MACRVIRIMLLEHNKVDKKPVNTLYEMLLWPESTKYLRVCLFCLWPIPPKRRVVRRRNLASRRVPTMSRTCAGFYVYRGRRYRNNDIFQKCVHIGPDFCCRDLRSVGATAGSRPITTGWPAGCSSALARCKGVSGVSQSDWPLNVYQCRSLT